MPKKSKKYVVRLTDVERATLQQIVGKFKGNSQKVRRGQVLLKADADGPDWTDAKIAEAFGCRTQTVENIRERFVTQGFELTLNGQPRLKPPREKLLDGEQEAKLIEEGLARIVNACGRQKLDAVKVSHRVGRLLGQNTRAAGAFKTQIVTDDQGRAMLTWEKIESWQSWSRLSEGCYLLRSNVRDWNAEELWRAYMQLSEAEGAFRIHKSDLSLRPVWHQKQRRVEAHVLVCFLAYVLWKTLAQWCKSAGLGDEPRKVLDEIAQVAVVDVVLPTRDGHQIVKRCVAQPDEHQKLLLHQLNLNLPNHLESWPM